MSGLQELAAIIGITEAAFRSISSLYNFVKDLQNAPREIQILRDETSSLNQSLLTLLKAVSRADIDIQTITGDIGLPNAIHRCGKACAQLQSQLYAWTQSGTDALLARLQFRRHKKDIQSVVAEINAAKQTAILTVVITQLSISLLQPASEKEKIASVEEARSRIAELKSSQKPPLNESCTTDEDERGSGSQSEVQEVELVILDQAYEAADKAAKRHIDIQTTGIEQIGDDNFMGMRNKGYDGDITLRVNDVKQRGNNNVIGFDA